MSWTLIKNSESLRLSMPDLLSQGVLGLDLETTALEPRDGFIRLIQFSEGRNSWVVDCKEFDYDYRKLYCLRDIFINPKIKKVIHNTKFEHRWIRHYFGVDIFPQFDTFIASQLTDFKSKHNLAAVALKNINVTLPKEEQRSDWSGNLSSNQYEYAVRDAKVLPLIREKQMKELKRTNQIEVAKIEFDFTPALADMETAGFPLNIPMYEKLCVVIEKDRDAKRDVLKRLLGDALGLKFNPPVFQPSLFDDIDDKQIEVGEQINLRSFQQILKAFKAMGVPLENTDQKHMQLLLYDYPQLQPLMDFRGAEKLVGTYGQAIIDIVNPMTGRIHSSFKQLGAETGRMSSTKPNLQNIPKTEDFRGCFRPLDPENFDFLIADYSNIELRILAEISGDAAMTNAFNNGIDLHSFTASGVFPQLRDVAMNDIKKFHDDLRSIAKIMNFSIVYGVGAKRLGQTSGKTKEEAQLMLDNFAKTYPQMWAWLKKMEKEGIQNGYVRTFSDRLVMLTLDKFAKAGEFSTINSMAERNAKNAPIQGGCADLVKIAAAGLRNELISGGYKAKLVNIVHDEFVLESPKNESKEVAKIVEKHMDSAVERFFSTVECKSKCSIGDSWAAK